MLGLNGFGQLGNGTTTNSSTGVSVTDVAGAVAIVSGEYQACALFADGSIKCWGYNAHGVLRDGTTTNSSTPVAVIGL